MNETRPLEGVKVIELSTFVAAACATRFFADQGADVIKVEPVSGDTLRYAYSSDGIPGSKYENPTFDLENANKRSIGLNLKDSECYEVLMSLIGSADMFVTNWRPQALEKLHLDYNSLKNKFPKLVYGSVTGYGEEGPDKDLPGYDGTAFFTRSGILGTTYEKGTMPINLINSMGDRATGMCLASGLLAALYKAARTGKGDKVYISLLGMAVFMAATPMQASQYGLVHHPMKKEEMFSPLMCSYLTKDGRFIQLVQPLYPVFLPIFSKAMGHEEWITDCRFNSTDSLDKDNNRALFYQTICDVFASMSTQEASDRLKAADIPFAVAAVWDEVLHDEQAWANDCFYEMDYPSGKKTVVRNPLHFAEEALPEYNKAPQIGANTEEILKELGWTDEKIKAFEAEKKIRIDK